MPLKPPTDVSQRQTVPGANPLAMRWWQQHRVWQEIKTPTPYRCDQCGQDDLTGVRFVGTAMGAGYQSASVICPTCRWRPLTPPVKKRKPKRQALPD